MPRKGKHNFNRSLRLIACVLLFVQISHSQVPEKDFRKMVLNDFWTSEELQRIENSEVVVRSLTTEEKQEIATIGVLKITGLPPVSIKTFRRALSQKTADSMKDGGRFSDPPVMADLEGLKLDKDTLDELRKCEVGKCDLNLSESDIRRFQNEVDWNSPDAEGRASQLLKEVLLGYAQNYLQKGDTGLGNYDNRRRSVDLSESHRLLLSRSKLISDLAPEFAEYLKTFPAGRLAAVEPSLHWSIIDFGLEPSIAISHAIGYTQHEGSAFEQLFVAAKQIYASRYLDSSLTFTLLVRVQTEAGVDAYLIFLDRSRSDALDGGMGRFARGIVKKESVERIKSLLDKAHLRLLAAAKPAEEGSQESQNTTWLTASTSRKLGWAVAFAIIAAAVFLILTRKQGKID